MDGKVQESDHLQLLLLLVLLIWSLKNHYILIQIFIKLDSDVGNPAISYVN
jgi:hypothetical protein